MKPAIKFVVVSEARCGLIVLIELNCVNAQAGIGANPDWKHDGTGFNEKKLKSITVARIGDQVYRKTLDISRLFAE